MAKKRSMTRNKNHDDASSSNRWSDLKDVLFFVMMKLGVIDFVAFSGVCKSWRSFALSNRHKFMARNQNHDDVLSLVMMRLGFSDCCAFSKVCKSWRSVAFSNRKRFIASRPPMVASSLMDFEGKRLKTIIPKFTGSKCVGLTCGYFIWFGSKTRDFWLVNPITKHQLHFPGFPNDVDTSSIYFSIRGILVFSPAISGWVFVVTERLCDKIWFCESGKGLWNHVSTTSRVLDLQFSKGKIYTLNIDYDAGDVRHLCEMRLGPDPKLMILKTKNFPNTNFHPDIVSLDGNLHVFEYVSGSHKLYQLDFGGMELVYHEKAKEEYAFYLSNLNDSTTAIKREFRAGTNKSGVKWWIIPAYMWYIPHDCFNVNHIDE